MAKNEEGEKGWMRSSPVGLKVIIAIIGLTLSAHAQVGGLTGSISGRAATQCFTIIRRT
jgi:hypothetical protein